MTRSAAGATITGMRVLVVGTLALLLASPAVADEVTRLPNGNVSVSARGTPLGSMLRQFGAIAPLDTSLVDPKVERSQVHLAVDDVPVAVALAAAFDSAGVSYAVWGSEPDHLRIVAFPAGAAPANPSAQEQGKAQPVGYPPPPSLPEEGYVLPNGVRLPPGMSPDDPDVAMITGPVYPPEPPSPDDPEMAEVLAVDPTMVPSEPEKVP